MGFGFNPGTSLKANENLCWWRCFLLSVLCLSLWPIYTWVPKPSTPCTAALGLEAAGAAGADAARWLLGLIAHRHSWCQGAEQ